MTDTTYPRVVLKEFIFGNVDIQSANLVEQFDPICATVPISTLDLVLHSNTSEFSALNPAKGTVTFERKQPLSLYEVVGGQERYIGLFFIDEWENPTENLIKFKCIDQIGLLDSLTYDGGIWLTPVTVAELITGIAADTGVDFEVDPDLADTTLKGWIPICTYREALQQIVFAAGGYVLSARQEGFVKLGRLISEFGAVTKGLVTGVPGTGQSRIWQKRWRPSQWGGLDFTITIPASEISANRSVIQRIGVSGVEVYGHNFSLGSENIELFNDTLTVGEHKITFSQPAHSLQISGANIVASGANYAVVDVEAEGTVALTGSSYVDSTVVFSRRLEDIGTRKENLLTVESAYLVNSSNGQAITDRVFEYHQLRFTYKFRMFAPDAMTGKEAYARTLFDQVLLGWIEKMSIDLARGFVVDAEMVGELEIPAYELYCGVFSAGQDRWRQEDFREGV